MLSPTRTVQREKRLEIHADMAESFSALNLLFSRLTLRKQVSFSWKLFREEGGEHILSLPCSALRVASLSRLRVRSCVFSLNWDYRCNILARFQ